MILGTAILAGSSSLFRWTFIFTEPRVGYRMANGERLVSEPTWAFA